MLGMRAFWLEPASLRVHEWPMPVAAWPPTCAPLRVAVLSDLHVGSPWRGIETLPRLIAMTQEARPELILLAGDYVIQGVIGGTPTEPEAIGRALQGLQAPLGVMAVIGNHDDVMGPGRVAHALRANGITVLDDEARRITRGACPFWVAGVTDVGTGRHDVAGALAHVDEKEPVIVLTHNPDLLPLVPSRVALTVAGHTHGGQVRLPLIGRPIVPSRCGQRCAIGPTVEDGKTLFVSPGIGTSILPVRFGVPPEISLLTITAGGREP